MIMAKQKDDVLEGNPMTHILFSRSVLASVEAWNANSKSMFDFAALVGTPECSPQTRSSDCTIHVWRNA
jgi:hypothetical protein